jgi:hypothetical protein
MSLSIEVSASGPNSLPELSGTRGMGPLSVAGRRRPFGKNFTALLYPQALPRRRGNWLPIGHFDGIDVDFGNPFVFRSNASQGDRAW